MRLRRIMAAVFATALLLSGCSTLSLNSSDILAPPRAVGNLAAFQQLIEKDSGGGYTLISPQSGEHKTGLMLRDLDSDGNEEAVALYTASDGSARILCGAPEGEGYRLIGVDKLSSDNVNSLSFADVDGDGSEDILVGCDAGAPIAALYAYMPADELGRIKAGEGFTDYVTGNFDGSGADDVLLLMPRSAQATAKAILMKYSDGSFGSLGEAELDPEVYYYVEPRFGSLGKDVSGAVLDGVLENNEYTTQLIYYDTSAHALINPLFVYSGYADTRRSPALKSRDINGDGVVEFPRCELMEYGKGEDAATVCYTVQWSVYDAGELAPVPVADTVLSVQMGCMLKLPEDKISAITARSVDADTMVVYSLNHKGQEPVVGKVMLTVKRYDKGAFDPSVIPEVVLYENGASVYTYTLANGSMFTDEEITDSFFLSDT